MEENLKLRDLDRGHVIDQIDEYLAKAVADIADPNKKATKPRVVQCTITMIPSKSRREAEVSYKVTLKPSDHVDRDKSVIYLGKDSQGNPIAKPYVPNQQVLPGVEATFSDLAEADEESPAAPAVH